MPPKPAVAQVPPSGGGKPGLRSAAKPAIAPAVSSSISKGAKVKAATTAATSIAAKPANSAAKSVKSKNAAVKPAALSNGGSAMSPPPRIALFGVGQAPAPSSKTKAKPKSKATLAPKGLAAEDEVAEQVRADLFSVDSEALFRMFVTEVPSFQRFKAQWLSIGSLSGQVMATQYKPKTFVADIVRDLSTPACQLDLPTATQIASYFAFHVEFDSSIPDTIRLPWIILRYQLLHEEMPKHYRDAAVKMAHDTFAANFRHQKRDREATFHGGSVMLKANLKLMAVILLFLILNLTKLTMA